MKTLKTLNLQKNKFTNLIRYAEIILIFLITNQCIFGFSPKSKEDRTISEQINQLINLSEKITFPNCQALAVNIDCDRYLTQLKKSRQIQLIKLQTAITRHPEIKKELFRRVNLQTNETDLSPFYVVLIYQFLYGDLAIIKHIKDQKQILIIKNMLNKIN